MVNITKPYKGSPTPWCENMTLFSILYKGILQYERETPFNTEDLYKNLQESGPIKTERSTSIATNIKHF